MEKNIKSFLEKIQWEHWITEISNTKVNLWWLDVYDKVIDTNQDLYFVSFTPIDDYDQYKGKRTKDSYVKGTTYFKADFDIRSALYEHEWVVISDETLMEYIKEIEKWLQSDELLRSYNAIVKSWNGAHFYWIWKEVEIDAETYSSASQELLERIKNIFHQRWFAELYPDFSCSNISRLMRIPGSMNHKEKYWLDPKEVKLLYYVDSDSDLVTKLPEIWKKAELKETERIVNVVNLMNKWRKEIYIYDNPFYVAINERINIAELVCKYTWRKLADNKKNFISNKDWGYTWAYVIPDLNIVVWKGTPHFSDFFPVYSPFSFIQVHYADWDAKKTFEKVLELYPEMKAFDSQFLYNAMTKYGI